MSEPLDIYVTYRDFGYVATAAGTTHITMHHPGPKEAAMELAEKVFPKGVRAYSLKYIRRGKYQATPKLEFPSAQ